MIAHPPLRYHGGKFKIASWIIRHFPNHVCYVEPYGGGASILLNKQPSIYEFYNDLDRHVVNFFYILRNRPDALIRAIELTPYSREEFNLAWADVDHLLPLEAARRFYIRSHQSFSNATIQKNPTWRFSKSPRNDGRKGGISPVTSWNATEHLYSVAARLKDVHIECDDALKVITRTDTPTTLFYVDPPYLFSTRERERQDYAFEMSDDDHEILANHLHSLKGAVVLSGYDSDLYGRLFNGWHKYVRRVVANTGSNRVECLWLSPNIPAPQLSLFG